MSVFRPDPEAGQQPTASDPPAFQLVRSGYDPARRSTPPFASSSPAQRTLSRQGPRSGAR
jgi:hypothetical protein